MPKTEIEYLLFTDSAEQVHSFIDDYYTHRDPLLGSYLIYSPIDVIVDEYNDDKGYSIECWDIHAFDTDGPIGEITYLSAPVGCSVRFTCYQEGNLRRVNRFIDEVIQKAKLLGFDPILIDDKIPETRDKTRIESRSQIKKDIGIIDLSLNKPGRPPDPIYDEAFRRLHLGDDIEDVFKWSCNEQGIEHPDKNNRDSFRSAMKRRHKNT